MTTDCERRGCRNVRRYFAPSHYFAMDICKDCDRVVNTISALGETPEHLETRKAFDAERIRKVDKRENLR